jgi:NAD(P)-dependent dehydrogenase (short-subunit alcohol dehydrogenase family)
MDALLDLTGEIILITGGAGAIGRVIVPVLAAHGAKVAVNDILPDGDAKHLLAEAGTTGAIAENVAYFQADTTQPDEVARLYEQVIAHWGMPTTVCCHAGIVEVAPVAEFPLDGYDRVMNVNLRSGFIMAQRAAQLWQAADSGGHRIFTTSWVQDVPWPEIAPYNVSKSGLRTLMRGFARELAPRIRANAIAPGIVGVGMARWQWDTDPSYRARAGKAIPLGELQTPESVAHAFLFLCSRMASYMTGSVLLIDGGCSLYPMD